MICNGIKYGSLKDWELVSNLYDQKNDMFTKKILQHSLGCTNDPVLLEWYLKQHFNETKIKKTECLTGITHLAKTKNGNLIVWDYLKKNWTMIFKPGFCKKKKKNSGNPAHLQKTKFHRLFEDGLNGCVDYGMLKISSRVSAIQVPVLPKVLCFE